MRSFKNKQRGDIAVYTGISLIVLTMVLAAAIRLGMASFMLGTSWDILRQRQVESRAVSQATKEAILAVWETAATPSVNSLGTEISNHLTGVTTGVTGVTVSSSTANNSVVLPANPQWPAATPTAVATLSLTAVSGLGRTLQSLLAANPVSDLGTRTFSFSEANTNYPGETPTYQVTAHLFSVPITNFNWIAYGLPTTAGGVVTSVPTAPSTMGVSAQADGITAPIANGYGGETGTFTEMFGGIGTALPAFYYRDLVSTCWNTFEYWTCLSFQNQLLSTAGTLNTFDFSNPASLPSGVTWDGTKATLDLGVTTASLIVFVDSVGGNTIQITGAAAVGTPVVVAVRNFSAVQTIVHIASNNSRTVLLYLPNTNLSPLVANLTIRAGVLLFPNSSASSTSLGVSGFVAYPQMWANPPALISYQDAQAVSDLSTVAPRVLLVATRAFVQ
jgi:hypothetical protein